MTAVSAEGCRPDLVFAYGYPNRSALPEHSQRIVLSCLCLAALQEGHVEVVRELTEKYPQYHFLENIDLEAVFERNKSLSPAECAAINSSGAPLRKVLTDLTSKAECPFYNTAMNIRQGRPFPTSARATEYVGIEVGPASENPAISVDVAFGNSEPTREDCPPYFELDLIDTSYGEDFRPRWHGSALDMLQLTDQCLQRMRDDPKATPWLVTVRTKMHRDFADDLYVSTEDHSAGAVLQMAYWTDPAVWKDIQQAYELALARSPNSRLLKSYYASWAVKCEQWAAADRLLTELGDGAAPCPFGGLPYMRLARLKARAMTAAINGTAK